jgi:hypothetical protein
VIERRATCRECGQASHTIDGRSPHPWRRAPAEPPLTWWRIVGLSAFVLAMFAVVLYAAPIVLIGLAGS